MRPSRDMAMFSGECAPAVGSRDRSKSPNVVCTNTGPSVRHMSMLGKSHLVGETCLLLCDPETTSPSSAEITTPKTGCSWPVSVALGVGISPSPTMVCVRAFQCHNRTVQSADPEAM